MTDGQAEELAAFDRLHSVVRYHVANTLGWPGLRPLQVHATEPVLRGDDCLLVAPTAGGKTEAAVLPLLSRMAHEEWSGVSVLYVCPLKALLNNLEPRLSRYASWVGRTASVRHGDTPAGARARQLSHRPSILMTTPESLEALLVSSTVDAHRFLRDARAVVVDEVHAFAGDDRGWHLLALLERVEAITGRPVQRIGLSATVGNPAGLLTWLQGPPARRRPRSVVTPPGGAAGVPELALDFVGSVGNASRVVRALHPGAKRLVFTDSRRVAESLAVHLQEEGTEAFVSHSSLSLEERRRSEAAFAEGRDCVIVSTSTLELGVDVGDLDHVLQVGAPLTVASVLQRLGRTGRRPGTRRNTTFLATDDGELLRATALLLLHSEGYVEPVVPPPAPRHIAAQQMLALTLERGRVDPRVDFSWLGELGHLAPDELDHAVRWLLDSGHLDRDGGLVHVGPEAEERFGRRHFMDLVVTFTVAPELAVVHGRADIGTIDPMPFTVASDGPRVIALAGRSWLVIDVDWRRRLVRVEPSESRGSSRWSGEARTYSFALSDAVRRVLLGAEPPGVESSRRARDVLDRLRGDLASLVCEDATVLEQDAGARRWWTFAGARGNAVLTAALDAVTPGAVRDRAPDNFSIRLAQDVGAQDLSRALAQARSRYGPDLAGVAPTVDQAALDRLKFSEMLPPRLATLTLGERSADHAAAAIVIHRPRIAVRSRGIADGT